MCLFYKLSLCLKTAELRFFFISEGSYPRVFLRKNNHILKKTVMFEISWP